MKVNVRGGKPQIGQTLFLHRQHSQQCAHKRTKPILHFRLGFAVKAFASRRAHLTGLQQQRKKERGQRNFYCISAEAAAQSVPEQQQQQQQQHAGGLLRRAGLLAACALAVYAWFRVSSLQAGTRFCSIAVAAGASQAEVAQYAGIRTAWRSAGTGLAAGCLHSLSGPDHLAALTPLTIGRSSVRASLLGAWWGFGHCIGQLILGLAMLLLKDRFDQFVPILSKYSSVTIGLTLMTIGALGLWETMEQQGPTQAEVTQETPPSLQLATAGAAESPLQQSVASTSGGSGNVRTHGGFGAWTLATGIVYGLQPDALFVIIPALALPSKLAAAAYMGMFVVGTVAAMGSYTAFIGATSRAIQSRGSWLKVERLSAVASLVALLMGFTIILGGGNFSIPFFSGH